jgi:hypothetical protein
MTTAKMHVKLPDDNWTDYFLYDYARAQAEGTPIGEDGIDPDD